MPLATEVHEVAEDLRVWQAYDPAVKCDLSSAALRTGAGSIWVDPIDLGKEPLHALLADFNPALIVLTNGNHLRAAQRFRERFGVPIAAHHDAAAELEIELDRLLSDGDTLLDSVDVVSVPGAGAGEIALNLRGRVLCAGDALIHLEPNGFGRLPPKYCANARLLDGSLRKLLPRDFQILTFAHGLPIVAQAHARLAALLA